MTITETAVPAAAVRLFRLGNAFCDAQALMTAVELDLFTALRQGPATADELRERLGLNGRGLRDFLHILVGLDLLTERDGRYANTPDADAHLVAGEPGYIGSFMLGAKISLYLVWGKLTEALRTGAPQAGGSFEFLLNTPHMLNPYVEMLDGMTAPLVPGLLDAIDWSQFRTVADIGGMRGSLAAALVARYPELTATVVDRPQMQPLFEQRVTDAGVADRVAFVSGDFLVDPLPAADVLVLGHIFAELSAEQRDLVLRRACTAVNPGGTVLIYDRILDDELTHFDNLVAGVSMVLVTPNGSGITFGELQESLTAAGFEAAGTVPLDDKESLVIGRKTV